MSLELEFPIEFVVQGTAVSLQAKRRDSIEEWQSRIRQASRSVLPEQYFASRNLIAVTLYYFPGSLMQGDIDNIVKPILDALSRHVYLDDRQVQRLVVQKFEPDGIFKFSSPSDVLGDALQKEKPALYVRLSDDPFEELA
jgi:crossover junction endodeoxyribonuclease RusA